MSDVKESVDEPCRGHQEATLYIIYPFCETIFDTPSSQFASVDGWHQTFQSNERAYFQVAKSVRHSLSRKTECL